MRLMWFAALMIFSYLCPIAACRAGEKSTDTPTVVIRVQSLDALLKNLNLVVKLVGQEEATNQIEGLVRSKIGKQGLEGIDPARPFGAYVRFGKAIDEITGAILIPMIDQKTFLTLLDNLGITYSKDKDGIYTHKTNKNINLYFRFAHRYLYVTSVNTDSIDDKNLPDPAKALAVASGAMITLVARGDKIPEGAKSIALAQLEETILAAQKKGQPDETKAQEEFRFALLREVNKLGSSLIRESAEMRFDLDVDAAAKMLTVNLSVVGKPGSELAKTVKQLGSMQSPLANLVDKHAAFQGAIHLALPDTLKQALASVIDEASAKSVESIRSEEKKRQAESLFQALMPSAKSGQIHLVAAVLGRQDKHYTFVAALKLKDGDKLGKTVRDLLQDAQKDLSPSQREKIQLDFDSAGAVKIHKFAIPKNPKIDALLASAAGDHPVYLAFRDDALFLALGKESLATLKTVIPKMDNLPSQPLSFDIDVARMAPLMARTPEQKDLAAKLFPKGQNGQVRLLVSGGSHLNIRLQMRLTVLEFLVKMKGDKSL